MPSLGSGLSYAHCQQQRFKYPSGSDTDPRLPLQSYQHSIISSQNFINTRQQSLMCLDGVFERGRDESSPSPELIRSDIGSAVGQTVKMSNMWYRSVVQLGWGGRDEGRLRKVKSWLRLAAGGITGKREMWSGGTRRVERRAGWVFSVMTGWRAAGSCFPAWWENGGAWTALSVGRRSLVQQRCSTGGDSQAYQVKKKCVPGHRGIFLLGQCVSDRSEVGWDQAG